MSDSSILPTTDPKPRFHIQPAGDNYEIYGVDAIWHNQYLGPRSDFLGFRKQYSCDINAMIQLVAKHVSQGLYTVLSMNATPNFLTVVVICERMQNGMLEDSFKDPSYVEETSEGQET